MKRFFFLLIVILIPFSLKLQSQEISESSEISIITCAPGTELYSSFGHTAIRVKDPVMRFDNIYNYGTFNFETPNFYIKFIRGQLDYMLTVSPYKYFVISYMNENRWIKEQVLNLTNKQKKEIFIFLQNNALPENMYYRYDFFYDNCATRVKDVVKDVLGKDMIMPETVTQEGETFKDLLLPYMQGRNWERFGINLALGQPANTVVNVDEATYLPDYHKIVFDSSKVIIAGEIMPLVKKKRILYDPKPIQIIPPQITPFIVMWILFGIVVLLTFIEYRSKKYFIILDKTLLFFTGFVGLAILIMWYGTEHKAVVNNWNIIWAMPLYFISAFMLKKQKNLPFLRIFMLVWSVILLISLVVNLTYYNLFDFALVPLILILLIRTPLIFLLRK